MHDLSFPSKGIATTFPLSWNLPHTHCLFLSQPRIVQSPDVNTLCLSKYKSKTWYAIRVSGGLRNWWNWNPKLLGTKYWENSDTVSNLECTSIWVIKLISDKYPKHERQYWAWFWYFLVNSNWRERFAFYWITWVLDRWFRLSKAWNLCRHQYETASLG